MVELCIRRGCRRSLGLHEPQDGGQVNHLPSRGLEAGRGPAGSPRVRCPITTSGPTDGSALVIGQTAIVTGVSGGIGTETASLLLKSGFTVIGLDKNPPSNGIEPPFLLNITIIL